MWIIVIAIVGYIAGILTAVKAVMDVRTPQGTVAWAIFLITVPWFAVPAFWVFGKSKFEGYVGARRKGDAKVEGIWRRFLEDVRERKLVSECERGQTLLVEKLVHLPSTRGNDAELLVNGEATFRSIFQGIARAKHYVLVQFYIMHDDGVGRELKECLIERARAGIACRLIFDQMGSDLPDAYVDELTAAGVQVLPFNTTLGRKNRFQINFRNHRKIVVVDGLEAWVGGLNIGDEYKGLDPEFGFWRDTHMRVAGPAAQCVQIAFTADWHWATEGECLEKLNWEPRPATSGASKDIACLPSGPTGDLETCTLFFLHAINSARSRLWIATPYFVPDEQFISAIQLAALRGVDVRIIIPAKADSKLVQLSSWDYLEPLQKSGIKVYRYMKGFMHQKVMLIDDDYCTVGTANFDNRSFRLNFEITLAVEDREFAQKVARMLEDDLAHAEEAQAGELDKKSFWFRLAVRSARLTAPIQ